MRTLIPICIILLLFGSTRTLSQEKDTVFIDTGWKFMPGDSIRYAEAGYDDSKWTSIQVDKIWENQGFEKLDGFAWYRLRFRLPSHLKESARLRDGIRIFLGKINNFDQSFLNGKIFGINGSSVRADNPIDTAYLSADVSLWNVNRTYTIPIDDPRILWDRENLLAIRVFDAGGQGGLWTGGQSIRMITLSDYLHFEISARPFIFVGGEVRKALSIRNSSTDHTIRGALRITAQDKVTHSGLYDTSVSVEMRPSDSKEISFSIRNHDQSSIVAYTFEFAGTGERKEAREETPYVLTPKPPVTPRINGAMIYGERPNRPFQYTIAATGSRPMTFAAQGLPRGLTLDPRTGIITGRSKEKGRYTVQLSATNSVGRDSRTLTVVIGNQIALTPPLGWNSWNCWGLSVDENKVLASARVFKEKGLLDHGWTYINIDDGWEIVGSSTEPKRDQHGEIVRNAKFTNMKALGDSIHALGMKLGIYSSPGTLTCGGYTASYQFEINDARSYGEWGIDYLKYDWCSYEKIAKDTSLPELQFPYIVMRQALDRVDRDIVYSLCQYGMGKVWEWGADVGGNLWRTTGDITDSWTSMSEIGFSQIENAPFAGPGHWNDPDMLVIGWVGWGSSLHASQLTPDEQYTHISLWCLLSAPLLIGCDLERLDSFTLNLLTNDEVLALDQDPLGKQAVPRIKNGNIQVWLKELEGGGKAIGIFNLGPESASYTLSLEQLGLIGTVGLRDVWRQKNVGTFTKEYAAHIPSHGVVLLQTTK